MVSARLLAVILVGAMVPGETLAIARGPHLPEIESARRAYWEGRFENSIDQLNPLIDELDDVTDLREASFLLGLNHLALGDEQRGRSHFASAVRHDPSFVPSEELYTGALVRTYLDVRKGLVGRLVVTSEPAGARVFVSGRALGATPCEGDVVAGDQSVKAESEGYTGQVRRIGIVAGRTVSIKFELSREVARASDASEESKKEFQKIKFLTQDGEDTKEVDATLVLDRDRLVVRAQRGGWEMKAFPYRDIQSAEYSYSTHPRWKEGLGAAVAVGVLAAPIFFLRGKKHWLTIQTENDFAVFRLDKHNYELVCLSFTASSGINVELLGEK